MRQVIYDVVSRLVDKEDEVIVDETHAANTTVIVVEVDPTDRGKIIGKNGVIADALRTLLVAVSGKEGHRYILEIVQ